MMKTSTGLLVISTFIWIIALGLTLLWYDWKLILILFLLLWATKVELASKKEQENEKIRATLRKIIN